MAVTFPTAWVTASSEALHLFAASALLTLELSQSRCSASAEVGQTRRAVTEETKDRLAGDEYASNLAILKACNPLSRLLQIAKLLSVDDLDDILDLVSASRRKHQWDLKLEETKYFLSQRVEFESDRVDELLKLPDN